MKRLELMMIAVLLAHPAAAQIEYEEHQVTFMELINVHSLNCVIPLGRQAPIEERVYTELREHYLKAGAHESIEMDHREAILVGCDLEVLDQLVEDSRMRFSHVEAEITVRKGLAKKPRIVFGQCQRNYKEQIVIDLGRGIVLKTPELGMLKPATGC